MLRNEYENSVRRIISLYPVVNQDAEKKLQYNNVVYEAVRHINAFDWEQTCKEVVKNANPRKTPMPIEYLKVYSSIKAAKNEKEEKVAKYTCGKCKMGFVEVYFIKNGIPYDGVAPCGHCNKSQYVPASAVKFGDDGVVFITRDRFTQEWERYRAETKTQGGSTSSDVETKEDEENFLYC